MAASKTPTTGTTRKPKAKAPTLAQLQATMADTKADFDAYYVAYYVVKDTAGLSDRKRAQQEAVMARTRTGKTTYWRAFNDPRLVAARQKARDAKAAKAAKA